MTNWVKYFFHTGQELIDVSLSDDVWVSEEIIDNYVIHQFKNFVGNYTNTYLTCELQSTFPLSISPIYLRIYYQVNGWETVDINNTISASTDFLLTATINDVSHYKNVQDVVAWCIYQGDI